MSGGVQYGMVGLGAGQPPGVPGQPWLINHGPPGAVSLVDRGVYQYLRGYHGGALINGGYK